MKRDDAFQLAIQWRDDPSLLTGDLRAAIVWLQNNSADASDANDRTAQGRLLDYSLRREAVDLLQPLDKALAKYTALVKTSKLSPELLLPVLDAVFADEADTQSSNESRSKAIKLPSLDEILEAIECTQRWVDKQQRLRGDEGNRSEILKTTIELDGDELLVKTDQDGSLKLRGSTNIPMFLAFFRTAKHFLNTDAFLDIDRTVKPTNLDRHRVRLSSKLHDVLIEIVSEKDGYRMRKYRP